MYIEAKSHRVKINARGSINALEQGDTLVISKEQWLISSIRSIAGAITGDTGKRFSVTSRGDDIIVTRKH
jgi:hypothetical protein